MQLPSIVDILTVMAFNPMVFAKPVPTGNPTVRSIMPMTYTGPIEVNGPDVTLYGDAQVSILFIMYYISKLPASKYASCPQEVHAQILALNPAFDPDDFEVVRAAKSNRSTTNSRRDVTNKVSSSRCIPYHRFLGPYVV